MIQRVTIDKLRRRLEAAGVDPNIYSLGSPADDRYCIERLDGGRWMTYLGDRGQKAELQTWSTEGEACYFILGMIAWNRW